MKLALRHTQAVDWPFRKKQPPIEVTPGAKAIFTHPFTGAQLFGTVDERGIEWSRRYNTWVVFFNQEGSGDVYYAPYVAMKFPEPVEEVPEVVEEIPTEDMMEPQAPPFTLEEEEGAPTMEEPEYVIPSGSQEWAKYLEKRPAPYEQGAKILVPGRTKAVWNAEAEQQEMTWGEPTIPAEVVDLQWSNEGWVVFFTPQEQPGQLYHVLADQTKEVPPEVEPPRRRVQIKPVRKMRGGSEDATRQPTPDPSDGVLRLQHSGRVYGNRDVS